MVINFEVPGEPTGKGRPRFVRQTGRTYTPEKTATYENLVKVKCQLAADGYTFPDDAKIGIGITAFFGIPVSASRRKKQAMLDGVIRPSKKPDADNILKIIADACNGLAYRDDAQICFATVEKHYAEVPGVIVKIWELE